MPDGLFDLLIFTAEDTLDQRLLAIMDRRYGFSGDDPQTLTAIGEEQGVSRERIRQLINKALRRIRSRGTRRINQDRLTDPAAQLMTRIRTAIKPDEENDIDRFITLAIEEFGHLDIERQAVGLLAPFLGGQYTQRRYRHQIAARLPAYYRQQKHPTYLAAQTDQLNSILDDVIWPKNMKTGQPQKRPESRKREVSEHNQSETGYFFSEKLNQHVFFESALEREFLKKLEWLDKIVYYQEQPLRIKYTTGSQKKVYYPDIFFELQDGRGVFVEIKPRNGMAVYNNWQKWAALRDYCHNLGFGFLITSGRYSLQNVGAKPFRPMVKDVILKALQDGPINWSGYKVLRERCQITTTELYALIIQERLQWQPRPFHLESPCQYGLGKPPFSPTRGK